EALRSYAKQSGQSLELQNQFAEIKLWAERRAGEMLKGMIKNKGACGKPAGLRDESAPRLEEIGISQIQSHRWQKIAAIPQREFEFFIADAKTRRQEITSAAVLRLAGEIERRVRKQRAEDVGQTRPLEFLVGKTAFSTIVVAPPWDTLGGKNDQFW